MGIEKEQRKKRARSFTPEEDRFILEHYEAMSQTAIGAVLGRSRGSIWYRYRALKWERPAGQIRGTCYHRLSLCWSCRNAVPNTQKVEDLKQGAVGCPWSIQGQPVPGWRAIPTVKRGGYYQYNPYDVHRCPMWKKG